MEQYLPVLQQCTLFEGVRDEDILEMLGCLGAGVRSASKDQQILTEGDTAAFVGILLSGGAHIVNEDIYGNRSIIGRVEPGQLFGESFACAGVPALPVSVVATQESKVMLIDARRITACCSNACAFHNRMIFNLLRAVAVKNLEFHRKLSILSKRTTRQKLMAYLLAQAKETGNRSFTVPFDRQGLADYLGVERSAMSAELGKLRADAVIDFDRSHFTIL